MNAEFIAKLDDCADELIRIKTRIDKDKFDDMVKFLQCYAIIKACGTIETVAKNMIADVASESVSAGGVSISNGVVKVNANVNAGFLVK